MDGRLLLKIIKEKKRSFGIQSDIIINNNNKEQQSGGKKKKLSEVANFNGFCKEANSQSDAII